MSFTRTLIQRSKAAISRRRRTVYFTVVTTGASSISSGYNIITSGKKVAIDWGDGTIQVYTGTGAYQTLSHAYAGAGTWKCRAYGDLQNWTRLYFSDTKLRIDLDNITKLPALTDVTCAAAVLSGGSTAIGLLQKYNNKLKSVQFSSSALTGDIEFLAAHPITHLYLSSDSLCTGDIGAFSARTGMSTFLLEGDYFTGDLEDLPNSAATMVTLWADGNLFTGDLSDVASYTSVVNLRIAGPLFTGDIASLNSITGLTKLRLEGFTGSFTDGAVPALNNCAETISLALSATEADNYLIRKEAAGKTGGSINIAGTNAARTSASDAAKAALEGRGVVVTANNP